MPCHRKNKGKGRGRSGGGETWFAVQKRRQRRRDKLARAMRNVQHRKAKQCR